MEGYKKAKGLRDKIKMEGVKEEKAEKKELTTAKNELEKVTQNEELSSMYNASATVGAENLGGTSPLLKIYSAGKTQEVLADGKTKPIDGNFYYKPTQEEFKELNVHILSISRGFRSPGMPDKNGKAEEKFNQLVSGLIMNEDNLMPFVMYFNGKKLTPLWNFGKEVSKYTHAKPVSIPMFALTVKLTTHEEPNDYGTSWVVDFEIVKNEDGTPQLITDMGKFTFIRDSVVTMNDAMERIISVKSTEEEEPEPLSEVRPAPTEEDF